MKPDAQRRRIIEGLREKALGDVLTADEMPQRSTVMRWLREEPEFAGHCLDARRDRAELLLEQVQAELLRASDKDDAKVAQTKIRHLEWYLERIHPMIYGKRMQLAPAEGVAALLAEARRRSEGRTIDAVPIPKGLPSGTVQ